MTTFTHLHVHSHYSLLGGLASIPALVERAVADGLTHLALTDANALYGAVAFTQACRQAGITPILGMVASVASPPGELDRVAPLAEQQSASPLLLLAAGPQGYRSLCRLSTALQGGADRSERVARGLDWETLRQHRQGLICLAGGRGSWIERCLAAGDQAASARFLSLVAGVYGEHTYLALELHPSAAHVGAGEGPQALASAVCRLGERFGVPPVAVQPVYCLHPRQQRLLRLLAAIDHNCRLDHVPAEALPDGGDPGVELHWLSPAQVASRFAAFPQAVKRVGEVAARCQDALPPRRLLWPALALPAGETPQTALTRLAADGLAARYGPDAGSAARQRLEAELEAIARHGFSPLFLLVAGIVRFARQHGIPVSTRGSVANSLVAYAAGISSVDPLAHDLLFERFLNPARATLPDIDLDFCSRRRDEVLEYVRSTYGEDRVALVATISTMRPKSAVRETGKAYGLSEEAITALIALTPDHWHPDPRRRTRRTVEDVLAEVEDERMRQVVSDAFALVGQPHHLSIHPGGMVVAPDALADLVPLQWTPKGFLITQFAHEDVEAVGLIKIDLLGIRALTVLSDAVALVRRHHEADFRLEDIPLDDDATGEMLRRGETVGVFQCESTGAQRTLRQLQARSIADLAVANAFFKPGPATGGMARSFIRRYRGEEPVAYLHPALEPILQRTKGVLIFQEQILRLAREIAGLSWQEADHLRRGMSKFKPEEMAAIRERFVAGCQRPAPDGPGFTPAQAQTLWEQVEPFAGYGFNQGHATAYADVSYRSAYLKAHWPAAFLCARLQDWGGFHHPAVYMAEALRLGAIVRPPHVNHSGRKFTLAWETAPEGGQRPVLWMGLGQVRDLRQASIRGLLAARRQQRFTTLGDVLERVPLQAKEITHLVQCGALDGLGRSRAEMLAELGDALRADSARQLRFEFLEAEAQPETAAQRLAWERRLLGQPVSVHPLDLITVDRDALTPLRQAPGQPGRWLRAAGVRLPGWTGGKGLFLSDAETYVVAHLTEGLPAPRPWQPLLVEGRWRHDEWGSGWLQVERLNVPG